MNHITPSSYKKLVSDIVSFYDQARKNQVEFYWNTGRRIVEVEQGGSKRAHRNTGLIKTLSEDLSKKCGTGFSERNLVRMRSLYLTHPYPPTSADINWSQHVELLRLGNTQKRLQLEKKAIQKELTTHELRKLVQYEIARKEVLKNKKPPELLHPAQGSLYTYRILDSSSIQGSEPDLLLIDLGFSSFRDLDAVTSKNFKSGDMVESRKAGDDQYQIQKTDKTKDALYTYEATIEKVVDADTLHVVVDLGFNTRTRQYLRLRGINAPERDTPEGKRAADFVKERIKTASKIILASSKSDKYDRYLADIFFTDSEGRQFYLNNLLLENGHAVRMGT